MTLQEAREKIASVDREMEQLFERRLEAAAAIADWKRQNSMQVRDEQQEERVIARNSALVQDPEKQGLYLAFLRETMRLTRLYQHKLLEGARVAYCGVVGAFAQIAAERIFPDAYLIACHSFEEAYQAVLKGECESAVLPVENSYAGEVGQVVDMMFDGPLFVNGVYDLAIDQCLIGTADAQNAQVRTVVSHPQALQQCGKYIDRRGFEVVEASNTAVAAQQVAQAGDPSLAAIASAQTASLYGLKILDWNVNESRTNTTRFAVFSQSKVERSGAGSAFILLFTVSDETGALAKAVNIISDRGFNMRVLRSRPMKRLPWHYYFYAEIEGDENSEEGRQLLEALQGVCKTLKCVGGYTSGENALQGGESI